MKDYLVQAGRIIDLKKTKVVYNSEWLSVLTLRQLIEYAMQVSANQLIEREDFANRFNGAQPVSFHELLYPIVQAIDSVHLKADVEIGGWDQRLNFLTAREMQKKLGHQPEQLVLMKPLIGLDGEKKMSKSVGNYIALSDSADQMFGKIMSIPDAQTENYAELAAWMEKELRDKLSAMHPRDAKAAVAEAVVVRYYGADVAKQVAAGFTATFKEKKIDQSLINEVHFDTPHVSIVEAVGAATGESGSQARRLIEQGGVRLKEQVVSDPKMVVNLQHEAILMQVGKHRFFTLSYK
jgi:tyrosyl-tRNA synthetase